MDAMRREDEEGKRPQVSILLGGHRAFAVRFNLGDHRGGIFRLSEREAKLRIDRRWVVIVGECVALGLETSYGRRSYCQRTLSFKRHPRARKEVNAAGGGEVGDDVNLLVD